MGTKLLFSTTCHPQTDGQTEVVNRTLSTLLRVTLGKNIRNWLECIPYIEFAYNRSNHSATKLCPFEIVYGFKPLTPLDITPLPQAQMVSQEGLSKADFVHKLHAKVKENLEKRTDYYKRIHDQGRKEVVFEPGDWVWLHMRQERFPHKRSSKLASRGDGPFRVAERINNNAYKLELPGEYNICPTFNVADLVPFDVGDQVLETKLSQGGGDDVDIPPLLVPEVRGSPMTRSKARRMRDQFNEAAQTLLAKQEHYDAIEKVYSFSQCDGFIPKGKGFPHLVFNEAPSQMASHDASNLAQAAHTHQLEQEDKGEPSEPLHHMVSFVDLGCTFMKNPLKPTAKGLNILKIEATHEASLA